MNGIFFVGILVVLYDLVKLVIISFLLVEMDICLFFGSIIQVGSFVGSVMNFIFEDGFFFIFIFMGVKGDYVVEEKLLQILVMQQLEDGGFDLFVFVLNVNLLLMVKIVNYVNRKCWCFIIKGMYVVGQFEIVIFLQCLLDEKCLLKDIFNYFVQFYWDVLVGNVVSNLGYFFFS